MGSRTIGLVIWASRRRSNCTASPLNATEPAKTARIVTIRKIRSFLVAREGIDPPTRGFSVICRGFEGFINQSLAASCRPLPRHTKAQSWHTQSQLVTFLAHARMAKRRQRWSDCGPLRTPRVAGQSPSIGSGAVLAAEQSVKQAFR